MKAASFVAQVRKIWKTKSAEDVSLLMFVAVRVGVTLRLICGFVKGEAAVIMNAGGTFAPGTAVVWMKLKFK